MRNFNTTIGGHGFDQETIIRVWTKGAPAPGRNLAEFRLDSCGALIAFDSYGQATNNGLGWEVDHIVPVSKGGSDHLDNLQPLQWQHNRAKSDDIGKNYCFLRVS